MNINAQNAITDYKKRLMEQIEGMKTSGQEGVSMTLLIRQRLVNQVLNDVLDLINNSN